MAAISEATGPEGEWGPGQFADIAEIYDRPKTDKAYWERVQLNLWLQADRQAFDPVRQSDLTAGALIEPGSLVTAGFDGARFRDATAIVVTDVVSGRQQLWALWERPLDVEDWEVPEAEVTAAVDDLMATFVVWRFNGDPPHWTETMGSWAGRHSCVEEWWTNRPKPMAYALRAYSEALNTGAVTYALDHRPALNSPVENETMSAALSRHIAAAARVQINLFDDEGKRLWILGKIHETRKFDACMAAVLSWEARLQALKSDVLHLETASTTVRRLY